METSTRLDPRSRPAREPNGAAPSVLPPAAAAADPQPPRSLLASTITLKPYAEFDGIRTFSDSELKELYHQAKDEGLLETVFYDCAVDKFSDDAFVRYFKSPSRMTWLVLHEDELAGWVWLDDMRHRTARIHFCLFHWVSRKRLSVPIARGALWQFLNFKFRDGHSLRVIRGETPAFNKLAARFLSRLGMEVIGSIPFAVRRHSDGNAYSMIYSYITKEIFMRKI